MSIKVIALGNILMGNDAIGIRVLEKIESKLSQCGIEAYIGETDLGYCLSLIQTGDHIIILDAALTGRQCGELTIMPDSNGIMLKSTDSHRTSLIDLIYIYHNDIRVTIIGIEVESIVYGMNISSTLENCFDLICSNTMDNIVEIIRSTTSTRIL